MECLTMKPYKLLSWGDCEVELGRTIERGNGARNVQEVIRQNRTKEWSFPVNFVVVSISPYLFQSSLAPPLSSESKVCSLSLPRCWCTILIDLKLNFAGKVQWELRKQVQFMLVKYHFMLPGLHTMNQWWSKFLMFFSFSFLFFLGRVEAAFDEVLFSVYVWVDWSLSYIVGKFSSEGIEHSHLNE